jgi:hypothetical protein
MIIMMDHDLPLGVFASSITDMQGFVVLHAVPG